MRTPLYAPSSLPAGNTDWRRLSPRMLLVHPVQEVMRLLPLLFGLLLAGSSSNGGRGWVWALTGAVSAIVLGTVRWFTTAYRITPSHVQVRRGLLRRRTLTVPRDRVRTVDVTSHVMHRILGLARVTVGTGQTDQKNDGVRLDGLGAAEAEDLHRELLHRPIPRPAVPIPAFEATQLPTESWTAAPVEVELARLDPRWIRYGPSTLSGIVTIGVVLAFASRIINEGHVDLRRVGPLRDVLFQLASLPLWLVIAEVIVGGAVFVAVASTVGYALAFWNFRLTRHPSGTLHVRRGLVTTRAITLEERRLRGVELSEPLLLRAVGGARCIAIATGLRVGRGAERGGSLLLPPAPRREVERVAAEVLGSTEPVVCALTPHGPRARQRRYSRALIGAAAIIGALIVLWATGQLPAWPAEAALLLLPAAVLLAADRYASLGHAVAAGFLVSRHSSLVRRRYMLREDAVIGWNLHRSLFQRRAGLVTLVATTAGGRQQYAVQDIEVGAALRLADAAVPGLLEDFIVRR
jgi:putative membrane protein